MGEADYAFRAWCRKVGEDPDRAPVLRAAWDAGADECSRLNDEVTAAEMETARATLGAQWLTVGVGVDGSPMAVAYDGALHIEYGRTARDAFDALVSEREVRGG